MKNKLKKYIEKTLKNLAIKILKKHQPDIIGITGSAGKSSAKEAVYQVLYKKFKEKVKKSEGNLNTEIGLPLAILGFKNTPNLFTWLFVLIIAWLQATFSALNPLRETSILILEYAADKPRDIEYLLSIARPKIGIITAIGPAHTHQFKSIENIAKEKGQLIGHLSHDEIGIIGKNNSFAQDIIKNSQAKITYFNDETLEPYKEIAKIVGKIYKIPDEIINNALKNYQPLAGRANVIKGIKDTTIIDDTYNANPLSMHLVLKKLKVESRKLKVDRIVIVLGDMRELGNLSGKYHAEIYHEAQKIANLLITVGSEFRKISKNNNFCDSQSAGKFILSKIKNNDIILVKGSRAMKMERVVKTLMATNINTKYH